MRSWTVMQSPYCPAELQAFITMLNVRGSGTRRCSSSSNTQRVSVSSTVNTQKLTRNHVKPHFHALPAGRMRPIGARQRHPMMHHMAAEYRPHAAAWACGMHPLLPEGGHHEHSWTSRPTSIPKLIKRKELVIPTCCSRVSRTPTASLHMPRLAYTSRSVLYVTRLGCSPALNTCTHGQHSIAQ